MLNATGVPLDVDVSALPSVLLPGHMRSERQLQPVVFPKQSAAMQAAIEAARAAPPEPQPEVPAPPQPAGVQQALEPGELPESSGGVQMQSDESDAVLDAVRSIASANGMDLNPTRPQPPKPPPPPARAKAVAHPPPKPGQVVGRREEPPEKRAKRDSEKETSDESFDPDRCSDDESPSDNEINEDDEYFARRRQKQMAARMSRFGGAGPTFGMGPSGPATKTPIFRAPGQVIAQMPMRPSLVPRVMTSAMPGVRRPIIQIQRPPVAGSVIRVATPGGSSDQFAAPLVLRAPGSASAPGHPIRLPAPRMIAPPPSGGSPARVFQVGALPPPPMPRFALAGGGAKGFDGDENDEDEEDEEDEDEEEEEEEEENEEGDEEEDEDMQALYVRSVGASAAATGAPRPLRAPDAVNAARPAVVVARPQMAHATPLRPPAPPIAPLLEPLDDQGNSSLS